MFLSQPEVAVLLAAHVDGYAHAEVMGWETGRRSEPAFMDMNLRLGGTRFIVNMRMLLRFKGISRAISLRLVLIWVAFSKVGIWDGRKMRTRWIMRTLLFGKK